MFFKFKLIRLYESAAQNSNDWTFLSPNNLTDNVVPFQHKVHIMHNSAVQLSEILIIYILNSL